jgi:hypothetical protein
MSVRQQVSIGALAVLTVAVIGIIVLALRGAGSSEPQWLLTFGAKSATLTDDQGSGTLVMTGPDATVVMFTDRPERRTATTSVQDLADQWAEAFASSAPNAALVDDTTGTAVAVLTLGQPTVTADQVAFPVTILNRSAASDSDALLRRVHLFIDPPAARLTDFHEDPMVTPALPVPIPQMD